MKLVVLVDLQKDFIDGALGSLHAKAIVPNVVSKVKELQSTEDCVFYATFDSHDSNYLETQEGKNLPVPHCVQGTDGWDIHDDIKGAFGNDYSAVTEVRKGTFGTLQIAECVKTLISVGEYKSVPEEIIIFGLCTDICVISNVVILKTLFPEIPVTVVENCCAGVSMESHNAAIATMRSLQVNIV